MHYTPIEKEKLFIREEKTTNVVLLRDTAQQFLLNSAGLNMLKIILENTNDDIALQQLFMLYPSTDTKLITRDFHDLVNLLKIFNIISYEEETVEYQQGYVIEAVNENEYNNIEEFIENNRDHYSFIGAQKGYYVPQNIRTHVINSSEYYFSAKYNGEIKAIIAFIPNKENSVMLLATLAFDKTITDIEMKRIWNDIYKHAIQKTNNKVNKIRWSYYSKNEDEPKSLSFLKMVGFDEEAVLLKELKNYDMHIYALFLK